MIISVHRLTEPPVSSRGEAAEGRDEEEEEGGRRWIHISPQSWRFSRGLENHVFQRDSLRFPARSERPLLGWRSGGDPGKDVRGERMQGVPAAEGSSAHSIMSAHADAKRFRWTIFKIKFPTRMFCKIWCLTN